MDVVGLLLAEPKWEVSERGECSFSFLSYVFFLTFSPSTSLCCREIKHLKISNGKKLLFFTRKQSSFTEVILRTTVIGLQHILSSGGTY